MGSLPDFVNPILFAAVMVVVLVGNVHWYKVKFALREEGKRVSWFVDHFRDFRLLKEVIASAESEEKRQRFRRMLLQMYWLNGLFLVAVGAIALNFLLGTKF